MHLSVLFLMVLIKISVMKIIWVWVSSNLSWSSEMSLVITLVIVRFMLFMIIPLHWPLVYNSMMLDWSHYKVLRLLVEVSVS